MPAVLPRVSPTRLMEGPKAQLPGGLLLLLGATGWALHRWGEGGDAVRGRAARWLWSAGTLPAAGPRQHALPMHASEFGDR